MGLRILAALIICGTLSQAQTVVFTGTEGANSGSPKRNAYTNCATSCVSGVWQPVNKGAVSNGQLACTSVSQGSCTPRSVVAATITGTGTTPLSNGLGAGGTDSLVKLSTVYGQTAAGDCGTGRNYPSQLVPSILLPGAVAGARAVFSATTAATLHNTSLLSPTKWSIPGGDAANYYIVQMCETVPTTSGSGVHLEVDLNHTLSNDDYVGPGSHYNFSLKEWDYCGQGCSGWKKMNLVNGGGSTITPAFPAGHHLYAEFYFHRTLSCSSSSISNCYFWDAACFKDYTAGTPMVCGNWKDAATGVTPGAIPVHKSGFTTNQINLQHQIDANCSSCTIVVNSDFRSVVAYSMTTRTPASISVFSPGEE